MIGVSREGLGEPLLGVKASEKAALALLTALWAQYSSDESSYTPNQHGVLLRHIIQKVSAADLKLFLNASSAEEITARITSSNNSVLEPLLQRSLQATTALEKTELLRCYQLLQDAGASKVGKDTNKFFTAERLRTVTYQPPSFEP